MFVILKFYFDCKMENRKEVGKRKYKVFLGVIVSVRWGKVVFILRNGWFWELIGGIFSRFGDG